MTEKTRRSTVSCTTSNGVIFDHRPSVGESVTPDWTHFSLWSAIPVELYKYGHHLPDELISL